MALIKLLPPRLRRLIASRPGLAPILDNVAWLVADKIVRLLGGLFVGIWVARYLEPEQFGQLNYASAFVVLFTPLAMLGLNPIVVRELVRSSDREGVLLGTGFALQLLGASFALLLMIIVITLIHDYDDVERYLVIIMGISMLIKSADVIRYWFEAQVISKYVVWMDSIAFVAGALAKVYLILNQGKLEDFAWVAVWEIALSSLLMIFVFLKVSEQHSRWVFAFPEAIALLAKSWPLMLSGLTVTIYMKVDQIMLGQLAEIREVGYFSAAIRLSEIWYFVPLVLINSLYPSLIRQAVADPDALEATMLKIFQSFVVLSLCISIPIMIFADEIVSQLYGTSYQPAANILRVHVLTTVFVFVGVAGSRWYVVKGLERLAFARTLVAAGVNVALNLCLIPKWGAMGAAFASLVAQAMAGLLFNALSAKTRTLFKLQCKAFDLTSMELFRKK